MLISAGLSTGSLICQRHILLHQSSNDACFKKIRNFYEDIVNDQTVSSLFCKFLSGLYSQGFSRLVL
jgi:hypothetical protein